MTRALVLIFLALLTSLTTVAGSETPREPWLVVETGLDVRETSPFVRVASAEQGAAVEVIVPVGARLVVDRFLLLRNVGEAPQVALVWLAVQSEAEGSVRLRLLGPPGSAPPGGTCCAVSLAPGAQVDVGLEATAPEGAVEGSSSALIWTSAGTVTT